jgi:cyclophilin family peptidyl-prolyl cis-trans isomerase
MKRIFQLAVLMLLSINLSAQEATQDTVATENPTAIIHTSMGAITLELFAEKAPISTENFITHVNSGFYDGTVFHRVIPHFMIQGGGFTTDMNKKPTGEPITNEATNGLSNTRGTVAMARTNDPHSATAQFFINVQDNFNLDYTSRISARGWGYAVFAKVTSGMEVVDKIRFVETETKAPYSNVPKTAVIIEKVEMVEVVPE